MRRLHSLTAIVLTGIIGASAFCVPIAAQASEEGKRNTAIGLSVAAAALLLTQKNKLPGLVAAGGAAYAFSQTGHDRRDRNRDNDRYYDDHRYDRDNRNDRFHDNDRNRDRRDNDRYGRDNSRENDRFGRDNGYQYRENDRNRNRDRYDDPGSRHTGFGR